MGFVYGRVLESSKISDWKSIQLDRKSSQVQISKNVCFLVCSRILEVPKLLHFHSNLKTLKHKAHTRTHAISQRPPRGPPQVSANVHARLNLLTFALITPTWLTGYLLSSPPPLWFWHFTQIWKVFFFFLPSYILSSLFYPPNPHSLSLVCLARNPPTHSMNMLAHKHRF